MQYIHHRTTWLFCALLLLSGSTTTYSIPTNPQKQNSPAPSSHETELWITIFVHGIMGIAPHVNLQNIGLFIRDQLIDTVYARAVHRMRKNRYFFQDQAMQGMGFAPIDLSIALTPGNGSSLFAYLYDCIDAAVYDNRHRNIFYTYGWSGLLSKTQRYIESEGLLLGIYQLIESYKVRGIKPNIRVIGYSHGGNVCLNMAHMLEEEYPDLELCIDELILIGMPVQIETDSYSRSPLFKKIYNIFSTQDVIQKMDFFSSNRLLSNRQFTSRRSFKVPKKMTQINLKISRLKKSRMCRKKQKELCSNGLKTCNRSGQKRLMRDASPGHLELWFFGWTNDKYRTHFPLYPLPAAIFTPYIISIAEEYNACIHDPYPFTIDIRPELNYTLVSQRTKKTHFAEQIPFIDAELFEICQNQALQAQPLDTDSETYQQHIKDALDAACAEYDAAKHPIPCTVKKANRRRRTDRKNQHKKARALPSHYKFLEPLS